MTTLKIIQIGNSLGVVLPRELLARLKVEKGDALFASDTPNGIGLTPFDGEFEAQMDEARRVMRKRRNVLRELAR